MLVRHELSLVQTLLRLAGIIVIAFLAWLVWYVNPVRSIQRSQGPYIPPQGRGVTTPTVPEEILNDVRLNAFDPALEPPMPLLFGRPDPFVPVAPTIIVPPSAPDKSKNDNAK